MQIPAGAETGAPGENRTPNLMVRSHALYPIELRAHHGRIVSLNYNGNRIVSPNPTAGYARRKKPEVSWISPPIRAKSRAVYGNSAALPK